jgi:hypothetical protein
MSLIADPFPCGRHLMTRKRRVADSLEAGSIRGCLPVHAENGDYEDSTTWAIHIAQHEVRSRDGVSELPHLVPTTSATAPGSATTTWSTCTTGAPPPSATGAPPLWSPPWHPECFASGGAPTPLARPGPAWINKPKTETHNEHTAEKPTQNQPSSTALITLTGIPWRKLSRGRLGRSDVTRQNPARRDRARDRGRPRGDVVVQHRRTGSAHPDGLERRPLRPDRPDPPGRRRTGPGRVPRRPRGSSRSSTATALSGAGDQVSVRALQRGSRTCTARRTAGLPGHAQGRTLTKAEISDLRGRLRTLRIDLE